MTARTNADRLIVKLSLFVMGVGAAGMLMIKPLLVGGMMDGFGYSAAEAGLVAGIEMAGVGVGTLLVVAFGGTWNRRSIAAAGAGLAICASIGPYLWSAFPIMAAVRFCAGIGAGVLVSVVIAGIALTRDPDRSFSLYYMSSALAATVLFPTATALLATHGVRVAYLLLAVLLLPSFALLRMVPRQNVTSQAELLDGTRFPYGAAAVSLSASVIYWIGTGAVWAFIERIGVSASLPETRIGTVLGMSQVTFVLGALSASLLHTRIGRVLPASVGVLLSLTALSIIWFGTGQSGFVIGILLFTFAWMFFFPYMTGAMAAQDPHGRVAVLGVPSQTLGLALGPAIGGFLVNGTHYGLVILLCAVAHIVGLLILIPALVDLDRSRLSTVSGAPRATTSAGD